MGDGAFGRSAVALGWRFSCGSVNTSFLLYYIILDELLYYML